MVKSAFSWYQRADIEDIIQDVMEKLFFGDLAKFEGRSSFRTWLRTLIIRHCYDLKRKGHFGYTHENSGYEEGFDEVTFSQQAPDDIVSSREELGMIIAAADRVIEIARDSRKARILAVLASIVEGGTGKELAERLDVPLSTVKTTKHNALKQMLQLLGPKFLGGRKLKWGEPDKRKIRRYLDSEEDPEEPL